MRDLQTHTIMILNLEDQAIIRTLKRRVIDISFKHKLSHLGSCLTALPIIYEIYKVKGDAPFVLSSGHAGLALYVILEHFEGKDAEALFLVHGVHPNRDLENGIYCSTGSLGQGLPIALGMALANKDEQIYCLISDGECAEGSIWETLNVVKNYQVHNLHIYVNCNWYGAYSVISPYDLKYKLDAFAPNIRVRETSVEQLPFLHAQDAHYKVMDELDYKIALENL